MGESTDEHIVHLSRGGVSLLAIVGEHIIPRIAYWGAELPEIACGEDVLASGAAGVWLVSVPRDSCEDEPALDGTFADGSGSCPVFDAVTTEVGPASLAFEATDTTSSLRLAGELALEASGLLRAKASVTNLSDRVYELSALDLLLWVPNDETEVFDQTGTWAMERRIQRHDFTRGIHARQVRNCRGQDAAILHGVCEPGASWERGRAHLVHIGWSGNLRSQVESDSERRFVRAGELLWPGEVRLARGERYETPEVFGSFGDGLDELSHRFHQHVRGLAAHPGTPRPVTLNTWEAVGFHQTEEKLTELADVAARVGAERFVVDDGWFSSRRNDSSGLGDWWVSTEVWPRGLGGLIDHVHGLGMQFGIWVEPEMVNPDSELFRAHPEWVLSPADHAPKLLRNQQALNLAIPECFEHVQAQLFDLFEHHAIDYVKWDHNRDLWEALDQRTGRPGYHAQTEAFYRLFRAVHEAFPAMEMESCMSGGGRIDLGIMRYAQRVWGSDCLDPYERWLIHDGTDLLLPPEVVGAHIGRPQAKATGRVSTLSFRAGCALFYHLGIEWDLTQVDEATLGQLGAWIGVYKRWREVFHTGTLVHAETGRRCVRARGVVSADRARAVFVTYMEEGNDRYELELLRLPGLDPERTYEIRPLEGAPQELPLGQARMMAPWWESGEPLRISGAVLSRMGLAVSKLSPEQTVAFSCEAVG